MPSTGKDYSDYVPHPHFGQGPRFTGFDPDPRTERVSLSWWCVLPTDEESEKFDDSVAVLGTAIIADQSAHRPMTFQFTHYYDIDRRCHDCGRRFIFFAEQQKYWYETLKLYGGVNCLHCVECRKKRRHLARAKRTYEALIHASELSSDGLQKLISSGLELIEAGLAGKRCYEQMQCLRRKCPENASSEDLLARLQQAKLMTHQRVEQTGE